MKSVGIVGLGYIGLPTAGLLCANGFKVLGIDIQATVVETINQGKIHIHEPGLETLIKTAVEKGSLRASQKPEHCDIFIIAVPTPFKENFLPDISYVESATDLICPSLKNGDLVILESTVPVGTTERIKQIVEKKRPELFQKNSTVHFAHCPERVLPGQILEELTKNDRVVGGLSDKATELACEFYRHFVRGEVVSTDARTAELCKLSENAFRDVNIAFANELSMVCARLNIDVWELIQLTNRHPRVKILQPGPGVGGHCIPVDPWFIVSSAPAESRLIRTAREVNTRKTHYVVEQIRKELHDSGEATISCLGFAFKANVDDFRESPATEIIAELAMDSRLRILAVEPFAQTLPEALKDFRNIQLVGIEQAFQTSKVIALLVDHKQFIDLDSSYLNGKKLVDTRGIWRQPPALKTKLRKVA